jgi:hypothetical protein
MTCSNFVRPRAALAAAVVLALFLVPAVCLSGEEKKSDIPSALALKLSRIRKALPREKVTHISKWPMREQRRYLLYVDKIGEFPAKLWGDDTVEKLLPPGDYAIVKKWPEEDRKRVAQYFKKMGKTDSSATDRDLEQWLTGLPGEERASIGLMLPSDQKSLMAVHTKVRNSRDKRAASARRPPRRRRPVPSVKPVVSAKKDNAEKPAGEKSSGVAVIVIIAAICIAAAVAAVVVATRKKSPPEKLEEA